MKKVAIGRRAALRGLGASVALPLLDAMLDDRGLLLGARRASAAGPPQRLVVWAFANGTRMKVWQPNAADVPLAPEMLSPALSPFAPPAGKPGLLGDITVVSGLDHRQTLLKGAHDAVFIGSGGPNVKSKLSSFPLPGGPSIDQVLAAKLGGETRFRSLAISNDKNDLINWCVLSWADGGRPIQPYRDPKLLFDALFTGSEGASPAAQARAARRKSLLDAVGDDARRLSTSLGAADRARIDEHLTALRELEKQIGPGGTNACKGEAPVPAADPIARGRVLMRLLVLALKCDLTRYVTFNHENSVGSFKFPGVNWDKGDHDASHNANDEVVLAITRAKMEELAFMLRLMKEIPEGSGTLLDNALVLCSSEIGNGNAHSTNNLPVLIAGKGGGFQAGRHLKRIGANYNDMLCSLLNYGGVKTERYGVEGTGPLAGL